MAKLLTFRVGYCTHPACMALKGAGLASRPFPARAYLIESRTGLYLWDTGYSAHFAEAARGQYAPYAWATPVHYNHEKEHLLKQLDDVGVQPRDLRAILLSHCHADHMAGLLDYPGVPVIGAQDALASIKDLSGWRALRKAFLPALLPADFGSRVHFFERFQYGALPPALHPFTHGWMVAGDLWIVPLPGHAEGHVGAFVLTESGWVLLAGDAAWDPLGYVEPRGPSELSFLVQHNRKAYYETLNKLHVLHHRQGAQIRLSHEQ